MTGLELQTRLANRDGPPIIFLTGHGDIPTTVKAMKGGATEKSADSGIWQSRPLRIKWQDWIAPGGRIDSSSGMPPVAAIMLHAI